MKVFFMMIFCMMISCKTCPECKPIKVPMIIVPIIACQSPVSLSETKKINKKDITSDDLYVNEKGEIVITESFNKKSAEYVNSLEQVITMWESYETCIENVIDNYEEMKKNIESTQ